MMLMTPERVLVAINDACVTILGYPSDLVVGRRADRWVAPAGYEQLEEDWAVLAQTDRICGHRELIRADGAHLDVQFAAHRECVTGRALVLYVIIEWVRHADASGGEFGGLTKPLTRRELQIVSEIAMGRRAHEIAAHLFISPTTVQTHVRNAMAKVGARSQAQLVAITLANGILDPDIVNREI
jgi:DNA-binding CsgD family transcriptional regulator